MLTDLPNKPPSQTETVPSDLTSILTKITNELTSLLPKKQAYSSILSPICVSTDNDTQYDKPTVIPTTPLFVFEHLLPLEYNIKFIKSLFNQLDIDPNFISDISFKSQYGNITISSPCVCDFLLNASRPLPTY